MYFFVDNLMFKKAAYIWSNSNIVNYIYIFK